MIKYLEKKVEIFPADNVAELKSNIKLEYYLVESDIGTSGDSDGDKVYGIEIIKKTEEEKLECEMVKNYSFSIDNAKMVLEKLASNTVTPMGLPFVLDDLLGA
jgi:hypothetical protein